MNNSLKPMLTPENTVINNSHQQSIYLHDGKP